MTVETDTIKNPKESPSKSKRKRASRSSSSGSSSSGSSTSSSASSRSSSSSSSNSSSSSSRSSSAASSPDKKKTDRAANKTGHNASKSSTKKSLEHGNAEEKQSAVSTSNQTRRSASPSRRPEKEKEATKIYIGKLSLNVNKEHLAEIFGTFGEIKEIDLPLHRIHPHLHRAYAHIDYVAAAGAEQACKFMEGGQIDGLEIVCALVHGQPAHLAGDRNRRETSPYRRRRRSPLPTSRHFPPARRGGGDRDRDRGRYNERRAPYSPPSRNYRRGPASPVSSSRRTGASGNTAESPKKKERRYSRSSSSESK